MPILWRYLISQYLRVLLLCTVAFIAILLTMRLDEIAHFATLGPPGWLIVLFILYQIPYILPIAIPISSLISVILLMQRLSKSHELTALRACGFSFRDVLTPLLAVATGLSLFNFFIVSEMATTSHLTSGVMKNELRSVNPLLLLHNKHIMRMKGFYFDSLGSSRMGEDATDIILATPNKHNNRLNLLIAKHLEASPSMFNGKGITVISSAGSQDQDQYDHLMLENIESATTSVEDFSMMVQKKVWTINYDHLRLPLLLVRLDELKSKYQTALATKAPENECKQTKRGIYRCYTEIIRRISISLATLTFTLMGAVFGISIGRESSRRGILYVVGLATLYLLAYFSAKGIDHLLIASSLFYLLPHLVIILTSIWFLNRVGKGTV